ncbi:hypothetical protein MUG91_G187n2 [Manis pentadactyla]|nr:hypothetical protein MUG91_G187n2 [Manis pentadactyla]
MSCSWSSAPAFEGRARVCVGAVGGGELVIEGHAQVALLRWWRRSQRRHRWRLTRRTAGPPSLRAGKVTATNNLSPVPLVPLCSSPAQQLSKPQDTSWMTGKSLISPKKWLKAGSV